MTKVKNMICAFLRRGGHNETETSFIEFSYVNEQLLL